MCQEEKEKKKSDQLERKKESQRLADEELESITLGPASTSAGASAGSGGGSGSKVTRAEIEAHQLKQLNAASDAAAASSNVVVVDESPLEQNINRLTVDGLEARSVDEAIRILRSVLTHTSLLLMMMSLYIVYIGEWRVTLCLCLQLPCTCIAHHCAPVNARRSSLSVCLSNV